MTADGFGSLTVPEAIINDIDLIRKTDEIRYRSRADVVKDAVGNLKRKILEC